MEEEDAAKIHILITGSSSRLKRTPPSLCDAQRRTRLLAAARLVSRARKRLTSHFAADLFSDPALEMLVFLYEQRALARRVSITDLATCDRVPRTTGLRYVAALEGHGVIWRSPDAHDGRRQFVDFTPAGLTAITAYLNDMIELISL